MYIKFNGSILSIFVDMTNASYHIIRQALIDQRNLVAQSPEAAARLIDSLGIRSLLIKDEDSHSKRRAVIRRTAVKKATAKEKTTAK